VRTPTRTVAQASRYHTPVAAVARRFWVRAAFIFAAIVVLAGCGHSGSPAATQAKTTTTSSSWSRPSNPPDPRTLLRAGSVAVAAVPNSTLTLIRTQQSGSWRVLVVSPDGSEQSMDVSSDAVTLLVGPTPKKLTDADKAKNRALAQGARLDYRAAVDKFLAAVPNGSITEMRLADSNGTTAWEADVWDSYIVEHKVTINATSGDLVANKQV
jgi:uncharacterized membrane protein YkoI